MQVDCVLSLFASASPKIAPNYLDGSFLCQFPAHYAQPELHSRAFVEVEDLALIFTVGQANGATRHSCADAHCRASRQMAPGGWFFAIAG